MTEPKTYSRAALIDMCGGTLEVVKEVLPWHDLRGDGLWLAKRESLLGLRDTEVMQWHPRRNSAVPALPIPFTAYGLAAFMLAGGGLDLYGRFDHDESTDEQCALAALGDNADEAREALREALRLRRTADDKFGRRDDGVRKSANWLLNDARRELTAPCSDAVGIRAVAADAAHVDAGQHAAPTVVPEREQLNGRAFVHEMKRRADPLAAVITKAKSEALDPTDWTSVWAALVALAQRSDRPPPLLGYTEGEGVKYQTDSAETPDGWMTREAWRKRASRGA